ncbi:MAG TPA: peptidoglycan DD-metalloendopeptidase family protein [Rhodanobacteraceae bacterium]|nr:peptidoglycan DD-metalloendopeptidase family protein [Rhodanobacteraceae bacterium]
MTSSDSASFHTARIRALAAALFFLAASPPSAASGLVDEAFGPDRSNGAFLNITRQHRRSHAAQAIAVDNQYRVLVLNEWFDPGSSNRDCAVTRHVRNARSLDMDFTGPDELEATRRIALDLGGTNVDICTGMAIDAANRVVIAGSGDTGNGLTGFVVRLRASDGAYDTTFDNNGKLALSNLAPFSGVGTYLNAVAARSGGRVLACGYVQRGTERNMLAVQFTSLGDLDTSFNGTGYKEIDFNGGGDDSDVCSSLQVLPNGDVVLAGTADDSDGKSALAVVRLNSNGVYDGNFSGDGRLLVANTSQLASSFSLVDVGYDAGRSRLLLGCNLVFSNNTLPSSGCVVAVSSNGTLDSTFGSSGREYFKFSDYHGLFVAREAGDARVRRILVRDDGSLYVLGTHTNGSADAQEHGDSDVVSLRMEADGSVITTQGYSGDGVAFHDFPQVHQANLCAPGCDPEPIDKKVADTLVDATWYRGNLLLLANRPRYPNNIFDHDGDGNLDEPGPIAPLVASIDADHVFDDGLEFDGLEPAVTPVTIAVPAGFGNYCSVRNASDGGFGLLPGAAGSDPCQQFLSGNPSLIVERAGLYSLSGLNWVIGYCDGGFVVLYGGNGTTPFDAAFTDSNGHTNCIFAAAPQNLPIFSRPYTGPAPLYNTQSFNHDGYGIPINVSEFGQPQGNGDACSIDFKGRQHSYISGSRCYVTDGVDETASDIGIDSSNDDVSVAPGRVLMAVPRFIPTFTPPGNDPYQREIFIRHSVGSGRYAEIFTTYYAHMQDTGVRRGDAVSAGTRLGQAGETGAASGEHLHLGVFRNRNLSWRQSFELNFAGGRWDRDNTVGAIDPWGWQAPAGVDPWAWRFRINASNHLRDSSGSYSTNLWKAGEAPPLD